MQIKQMHHYEVISKQGWVFAMAKSIFVRTVEKPVITGNNWHKSVIHKTA